MAFIGNNLTIQQYAPTVAYFNGNGSTTVFTLPIAVVSSAQIIVVIENVIQNPSSAFGVSGTTLTFTSAPPSGTSNIWVEYTSLQTNTIAPSQGTVGISQLSATGTPSASTFLRGDNTWGAAGGGFSAGTVMLFYQSAAPTGWTKLTTQNDKALRVVSGTGGVAGGSVAFTTAFASQAVSGTVGTSGATTLSTAQIASHAHGGGAGGSYLVPLGCYYALPANASTGAAGGGGSHTHPGGTFTGTAINLAVQYIDIIIASKD
jgi:hypothetical protein